MPKQWRRFYSFAGGLNTRDASQLIDDDQVQDIKNFKIDPSGKITTRPWMALSNTMSFGGTATVVANMDSLTPAGPTPPAGTWTNCTVDTSDKTEGTGSLKITQDLRKAIISDADSINGTESGWTVYGGIGAGSHTDAGTPSSLEEYPWVTVSEKRLP